MWFFFKKTPGNSLVDQWLGLCALTAEAPGLIPGQPSGMAGEKKKTPKRKVYHLLYIMLPKANLQA